MHLRFQSGQYVEFGSFRPRTSLSKEPNLEKGSVVQVYGEKHLYQLFDIDSDYVGLFRFKRSFIVLGAPSIINIKQKRGATQGQSLRSTPADRFYMWFATNVITWDIACRYYCAPCSTSVCKQSLQIGLRIIRDFAGHFEWE